LWDMGLYFGMGLLPTDACARVGAWLSTTGPKRFPESDARARRLWRRYRPDESDPASTDAAMRRLWRCVGQSLAEFSVFHRFWAEGRVEVAGIEYMYALRATGKPILMMALHLGNWEVVPLALERVGYTGAGIYLPPDNPFDHYIALQARRHYETEYFPPGPNAARDSFRALMRRKGYLLYVDELI